jgi:hypothetical protein
MASTTPTNAANTPFWRQTTAGLHDLTTTTTLRNSVPDKQPIAQRFQTFRASPENAMETLAYLILQISKSTSKSVIARAIASGVAIILKTPDNLTGSLAASELLTGLQDVTNDTITDRTATVTTNFAQAAPVTLAEIDALMESDSDEFGAYFGVCCLAMVKKVTPQNRIAFNDRRRNSVNATITSDPVIFVENSIYLTDLVLKNINVAFVSLQPIRMHLVSYVCTRLGEAHMGISAAFMAIFLLLRDQGMGALKSIKQAALMYPEMITEFPELRAEFNLADAGIKRIGTAIASEREFVKAIYGSMFQPVPYAEILTITGIAKRIVSTVTPSFANYGGGRITAEQAERVDAMIARRHNRARAANDAAPAE